jgi:hypothetical protein
MKNKRVLQLFCMILLFTKIDQCDAVIPNGWNLPPVTLSNYLVGYTMIADSLSMALDAQGNAIAVWKAKYGSDLYLLIARFEASTNLWSTSIKTYAGINITGPLVLRMTKAGDAFIMWQNQQVPDYVINSTKFDHNASWVNWVPVVRTFTSSSRSPLYQCAINEQGDALFVYATETTYESAFYDHSISWDYWSPSGVTTPIDFSASSINLSLDANGRGLAVYDVNQVLLATQYISSAWGTVTQISSIGALVSKVNLVLEPSSGKNYVLWVENDNSVHATQYGQIQKTLDSLGVATVGNAKEGIDLAGRVTFMWTVNATNSGSLRTTYFNSATWNSWSPAINTIVTSTLAPITHWNMAIQPLVPYQVFALWELYDGTQYLVQANEATEGSWISGTTQNVFALGNNRAADPQIGMDGSGNALALWGQAADQSSVTKIIINAIWYDISKALWQEKSTVLSNSCYCNCA